MDLWVGVKGWMCDRWMDGWMDGWMDVKAILRTADHSRIKNYRLVELKKNGRKENERKKETVKRKQVGERKER